MSAALREAAKQALDWFTLDAAHYHDEYGTSDEPIDALRAALIDEAAEPREEGLREALNYALNQWAAYSDADRGPHRDFDYIATSTDDGDAEAERFRWCRRALAAAQPKPSEAAEPEPALDVDRLARAYTLLISSEPALVRAYQQSPNPVTARLNAVLHDAVLDWLVEYGDENGRSDPRTLSRLVTPGDAEGGR